MASTIKRKEQLLQETIDAFIEVGFRTGSLSDISDNISKHLMGYGTAADEEIYGAAGFKWLLERQLAEIGPLKVKMKRQEKFRHLFSDGNSALIAEDIEFSMDDGESVESFVARFSFVLEYAGDKWEVLHFHSSVADTNVLEGKSWPLEELKRRNIELQQSVDEKTAQLQERNRELEIEASVEKVRVHAMAMHTSEDIMSFTGVLRDEITHLRVPDFKGASVFLINDDDMVMMWDISDPGATGSVGMHKVEYNPRDFPILGEPWRLWKEGSDYFVLEYGPEKFKEGLNEWKMIDQGVFDTFHKAIHKGNLKAQWNTMASFSKGLLSLDLSKPPDDDVRQILVKMAGAFDLAYQRYEDLRKAEAQAREALIEAALERVRVKAMSMQSSDDLGEAIAVVFQEMARLEIPTLRCGIAIIHADTGMMEAWIATETESGHEVTVPGLLPVAGNRLLERVMDAWQAGEPTLEYALDGEELKQYYATIASGLPLPERKAHKQKQVLSAFFFPEGGLYTYTEESLTREAFDIFQRFTNVFALTYTRFLDLQKAEAQAREAQIEVALERVRARSMAMQDSDELREVVAVMLTELQKLSFDPTVCEIIIFDKTTLDLEIWQANEAQSLLPASYHIPVSIHPVYQKLAQIWQDKIPYHVFELSGESKRTCEEVLFTQTDFRDLPEAAKDAMMSIDTVFLCHAAMKHGLLEVAGPQPLSDEKAGVMQRFAKTFEQVYTRFLDLQKAEAQAREAQIEAALERVRSRTMAMHQTDELQDVVVKLFEELDLLGFDTTVCNVTLMDRETKTSDVWTVHHTDEGVTTYHVYIPFIDHPFYTALVDSYVKGKNYAVHELAGDQKRSWVELLTSNVDYSRAPAAVRKANAQIPDSDEAIVLSVAPMQYGMLVASRATALAEDEAQILQRFSQVFEQTYTRFLDLQKAEEQAREAQIEAALERVRARTMAMHRGDELADTAMLLFEQLLSLGFKPRACGFLIMDKESQTMEDWSANIDEHGAGSIVTGTIAFDQHPVIAGVVDTWRRGDPYYIGGIEDEKELQEYYAAVTSRESTSANIKEQVLARTTSEWTSSFYFEYGMMYVLTPEPITDQEINIMQRFAGVFRGTYRRFLDLVKAEAQAREARIEAALERVRSKTMAMHNSHDVGVTVVALFDEVLKLGIDKSIRCGIGILDKGTHHMETWSATSYQNGEVDLKMGMLDMTIHPMLVGLTKAWKSGASHYSYDYFGDDVTIYYNALNNEPEYPFFVDLETLPDKQFHNSFFFSEGILFAFTSNPISEDAAKVLHRFAGVFGQTYRRYLDLQKAEAQAHEAQIEAALERIRSRSMAMQHSDELAEVSHLLNNQVRALGTKTWGCAFNIYGENESTEWFGSEAGIMPTYKTPREKIFLRYYEKGQAGETLHVEEFSGEKQVTHYEYMLTLPVLGDMLSQIREAGHEFPVSQIDHVAYFKYGYLLFITLEPAPEEYEIFKRFAKVFEQTYTRFLDLQKAEQQAREAQIEAALERVRAKTMAMHRSEQLSEAAAVLFDQLRSLGEVPDRMSITVLNAEEGLFEFWLTDQSGMKLNNSFRCRIDEPTTISKMHAALKAGKRHLVVDLQGNDLDDWLKFVRKQMQLPIDDSNIAGRRLHTGAFFSKGMLLISSHEPIAEPMIGIMERFAAVFDQTYTRFLDLLKAEAQAREAIKQAALDRIRGEIASMRTSEDLNRITPVIWRELETLEVPFIRCGVFIVDEEKEEVQAYLTTPHGESLGVLNLSFDANALTSNTVDHWKKHLIYKEHWNQEEFINWTKSMIEIGQVQNVQTYQGASAPPESLDLHFVPFTQGMLYVGDVSPLTDEKLELVLALAKAFSIAYARYEDFKHLEKAKNKIEVTLDELKSAQTQLIQSEKMASLGELTAGIAHEIKNPLNFVNNFSEVSHELLEEMKEELASGRYDDASELAQDVIENLEKIIHHGKRADGIVRGMLQHSRGSSSQKELTDINLLADEYLRLAYHGLRARDKSFNAEFETNFDETLPKINIVPQDIGRVLLNLVNNAFYACTERRSLTVQRATSNDQPATENTLYQPLVSVSTKHSNGMAIITVSDNGNGIPQHVLDKIFQPFFTTKPTGEGTGLGLSLAYDIITKTHGGDIEVDSKENQGATFIIKLPIIQ